jgi:hypothetical protein
MVLRCGRLFDGRRMWVRDTQHQPDECIVVVIRGELITQVCRPCTCCWYPPSAYSSTGGVTQQVGWESEVGPDVATGAEVIDLTRYTVMPGTTRTSF